MIKRTIFFLTGVALVAAAGFYWNVNLAHAEGNVETLVPGTSATTSEIPRLRSITPEQRKQAAIRAAERQQANIGPYSPPVPGGQPNYYGPESNYANSPLPIITSKGKVDPNSGIRKFVQALPGLDPQNQNELGNYIPVAVADKTTYPGSDYYEIALVEYTQKVHPDLPPTTFRGYVQTNTTPPRTTLAEMVAAAKYLGPTIIATQDRPVRVKFTNLLPTGSGGDIFLPVDTTIMGAGLGPNNNTDLYTQNRATIHLHGGVTQWISDGTPHQWITPAGEVSPYTKGASAFHTVPSAFTANVPDMLPYPGTATDGIMTFYYPNQSSARLMFYHDHAYGITRLNVYAGEAAGYLLNDPEEELLINNGVLPNAGGIYRYGIPLIIQDKTFIPPHDQLIKQDPTWNWLMSVGSLWFPHVYMPNQNPNDLYGVNPLGRWDYGPWFWPLFTPPVIQHGPVTLIDGTIIPGVPNVSIVPEAFMDTPVVNGAPYPYLEVDRKPYRFRILNICNERFLNLQLYYAEPVSVSITDGGSGYTKVPKVTFSGGGIDDSSSSDGEKGKQAEGIATIENGQVTGVVITDPGSGYLYAPNVHFEGGGKHAKGAHAIASINSEVKMVPACPDSKFFPPYWPTMDGRAGGVPDPRTAGPSMIQIGTEGGFLPAPVVLPNTPIGYQYNRRDITVLNVLEHTLYMGPAERADVIIDFSQVPKHVHTLILYNDAPAPVPAFDPRYDYYTNNPDLTDTGGAPSTLAGYGPNTRTIMQFRLTREKGEPFNLTELETALPLTYLSTQPAPIVPETFYPGNYQAAKDTYATVFDYSLTYIPVGSNTPITTPMIYKAIAEEFELDYGRMNAVLGSEVPFTNGGNQTTILLAYRDPPTEYLLDNDVQIWDVVHNGVDTHAIHFHLFNVQLINRVGWDGAIRGPDANERGWKDTVKMNPLENCIVALKPKAPVNLPWAVPTSTRYLDPTSPPYNPLNPRSFWTAFDPLTGAAYQVNNELNDYGWEYVWHCHLLSHEENDMMRPIVFSLIPALPSAPRLVSGVAPDANTITVSFSGPESQGSCPVTSYTVTANPGSITATGPSSPIDVTGLTAGTAYTLTVTATNCVGTGPASAPIVVNTPP